VIRIRLTGNAGIHVYPGIITPGQPFTIEATGISGNVDIRIIGTNGQLIKQEIRNASSAISIETNGLKTGTYIVSVSDKQKSKYYSKIVIQ
jgi:Secretion system C-terminal sorting domain